MFSIVTRAAKNFEIADVIVEPISVLVMNYYRVILFAAAFTTPRPVFDKFPVSAIASQIVGKINPVAVAFA